MWKGESWDVDAFWTRPVTVDIHNFDAPNLDEEFAGVVCELQGLERAQSLILWFEVHRSSPLLGVPKQTNLRPLEVKLKRVDGEWLWDFEGAVQSGTNANGTDHIAGMWTAESERGSKDRVSRLFVLLRWATGG